MISNFAEFFKINFPTVSGRTSHNQTRLDLFCLLANFGIVEALCFRVQTIMVEMIFLTTKTDRTTMGEMSAIR